MGGGKTHLLVGFGLLAKHPELRKTYCGRIALRFMRSSSANIAAFNGRNNPDHFFWGEIADQLGKGEQFKAFWTSGPKAPDEKDWLKLFDGDEPILILLDEMPPYFHYLDTQKVGNGTVADIATRAFANLLTAAGKKKQRLRRRLRPGGRIRHRRQAHQPRPRRCARRSWAARSATSRRSTSPPTRSTTSCASAFSNRFPTRPKSSDIAAAYGKKAGRGQQVQSRQSWRRSHRRRDRRHLSRSTRASRMSSPSSRRTSSSSRRAA